MGEQAIHQGENFWKNYMEIWFGKELISKWEKNVKIERIKSGNREINVEVYNSGKPNSSTIVFSHGIAGYARVLLPFLIPLFEKGYNIVAPDLMGFGYNTGLKGDYTWNNHLENLKDATLFAKNKFTGKVFLGGASMGGPLAYATDARYNCADGLICWCLFDFADKEFINKETNTKRLTYPLLPFLKLSSALLGKMRLKTEYFVSYDTLTESTEFNHLLKEDPQAGTLISLRGATSLVTQSKPDVLHAQYNKPVLVCQPENDRMTPAYYTQKVFEKLKSTQNKYVPFIGGHFPIDPKIYLNWGQEVDNFIQSL
jgi:pimeloyl-ACP methyl ester carboxylesterase